MPGRLRSAVAPAPAGRRAALPCSREGVDALAVELRILRARLAPLPALRLCVEVPAISPRTPPLVRKRVEAARASLGLPDGDVREGTPSRRKSARASEQGSRPRRSWFHRSPRGLARLHGEAQPHHECPHRIAHGQSEHTMRSKRMPAGFERTKYRRERSAKPTIRSWRPGSHRSPPRAPSADPEARRRRGAVPCVGSGDMSVRDFVMAVSRSAATGRGARDDSRSFRAVLPARPARSAGPCQSRRAPWRRDRRARHTCPWQTIHHMMYSITGSARPPSASTAPCHQEAPPPTARRASSWRSTAPSAPRSRSDAPRRSPACWARSSTRSM
jgi:hypothetical protein